MSANAHFIQAAKLLTPGASYHASLVLPSICDLADIARRISVGGPFGVAVSSAGPFGTAFYVSTCVAAAMQGSEDAAASSPEIDHAIISALLLDEAILEFGAGRVAAAAGLRKDALGNYPAPTVARVLGELLLGEGQGARLRVLVKSPTDRLRLRLDGSMSIALQIAL